MAKLRFRRLDGTIAGEDPQPTERPPVRADDTLPPVDAATRLAHAISKLASGAAYRAVTQPFAKDILDAEHEAVAEIIQAARDLVRQEEASDAK